ncbi:MAG: nucleoside triphosphate pyrophosphohydrolase [Hyphomicrobiales bacterium]|nr:nucleoside triphosphate pyrophosphohydrolase [Hyphomicrobiales bacterium]
MKPSRDIARLLEIMLALRTPQTGCPWDLRQTFASIAPYTIEEAYEVADAIGRGDMGDLADELGDLLLQVVFHAQMAQEQGEFAFGDVVYAITSKMIRRHPHVFAADGAAMDEAAVQRNWQTIKAAEKAAKAKDRDGARRLWLDDVPAALPALTRAVKLQARAGEVGFDWSDPRAVIDKIREETGEIAEALDAGAPEEAVAGEIGDLLFAVANLARHLGVDPEAAVRRTNAKFIKRFSHIERTLAAANRKLDEAGLDEMEALWQHAKTLEA